MANPFSKSAASASGAWGELFQYTYADGVLEVLDVVDDFELMFDSMTVDEWPGGDSLYEVVRMSEGSGGRYLSGGPTSTAPVFPKYQEPSYQERRIILFPYGDTLEITGPKLIRAMSKKGMYAKIMDEMIENAMHAHRNQKGPLYWGNGTGVNCVVDNAGSVAYTGGTNQIPVEAMEISVYSKAYMTYGATRNIREGMQLQIGTAVELAANTPKATIVVTSVDHAAETFHFSPTGLVVTLADGDLVVRGDANGNEYNRVITGMYAAIDNDNTYHNINRSTAGNRYWQAHLKHNNNAVAAYSSFNIYKDLSLLKKYYPGGSVADFDPVIFSEDSLQHVFMQDAVDPAYVTMDLKTRKGYELVAYSWGSKKVPWQATRSHPYNSYTILDRKKVHRLKLQEDGWDDTDGSIWRRVSSEVFAFRANTYNEEEVVVTNPRCALRREDIDVPTGLIEV